MVGVSRSREMTMTRVMLFANSGLPDQFVQENSEPLQLVSRILGNVAARVDCFLVDSYQVIAKRSVRNIQEHKDVLFCVSGCDQFADSKLLL